ncbi:MAG: hypothetical protein IJT02_05955 [Synergistaceae bacterium]|nr:hypothetical protein [Synergistaceae bacterium]
MPNIMNMAGLPLWNVEKNRKLHSTAEIQLSSAVNSEALRKAVDETLKVFPLLRGSLILEDGVPCFTDNDKPIVIPNSEQGLIPGCDALNNHIFCVSYFGDRVKISLSHVATDGGGFLRFVNTIIYYYCCINDGTSYAPGSVMTVGNVYSTLDADFWELDYSKIQPVNFIDFLPGGFVLPAYADKSPKPNIMCTLRIPQEAFMNYVKAHKTSPSVMAMMLFMKAVYNVHPEAEGQHITGRITVDARRALGLDDTMRNCSLVATLQADRAQLDDEELGQKMRASLKLQTSPEYLQNVARALVRDKILPGNIKPTVSLSYMGTVSFGEYARDVQSFVIYEGEFHKLNIFVFNDTFCFAFHMGEQSCSYARAIEGLLAADSVPSTVSGNIVLNDEAC